MVIAVKIFGVFIIGAGIGLLINPASMKQFIVFWGKGKRLYLAALIRVVMGTIFILVSEQSRWPEFLFVFGMLMFAGAASIVALGLERAKRVIYWWGKRSSAFLWFMGLVVLVIGAMLLSSVTAKFSF